MRAYIYVTLRAATHNAVYLLTMARGNSHNLLMYGGAKEITVMTKECCAEFISPKGIGDRQRVE
jgi:hypothetical protein